MKRVLIVSYWFPPLAAAGSIRLAGLARHLPDVGWDPTVLAPAGTAHAHDPGLAFPEEQIVRSRSIELTRAGRALSVAGGSDETAVRTGLASTLRGLAHRWVYYPDAQIGWYPGAVRRGRRLLGEQRFDVVLSSSLPITAHLIGRRLAARAGIPWVADFRDPWSDRIAPGDPHRERARRLEQSLADDAAALLMTTESWAQLYGERWGKRILVVPNGFDGPAVGAGAAGPAQPVVTHLGSYYPGRQDYGALWRVVDSLPDVRLRIVGDLNGALRAELAAAGIADRVDATGYVAHDEVRPLIDSSSLLVAAAFNEDDPVANGVIFAKLYDYLATERPILYLSRPGSEGARLLAGQDGCFVVDPTDEEAVAAVVGKAIALPASRRNPEQWSRRAAAVKLAAALDEVSAPR